METTDVRAARAPRNAAVLLAAAAALHGVVPDSARAQLAAEEPAGDTAALPVPADERLAHEAVARAATEVAHAVVTPIRNGEAQGTVELFHSPGVLVLHVELSGLTPGMHGFHIHDRRDCDFAESDASTPPLDPDGDVRDGAPETRHAAGDLGNLRADDDGVVRQWLRVDDLELHGEGGVFGRAIVVHALLNELGDLPGGGDPGRPEACGIIGAP